MSSSPAHDLLSRIFGYDDFRGPQQAIVEHVAAGNDALVLMPTGGGKSLCYQVPSLLREGTGIPPHRPHAGPGRSPAPAGRAR
jgi:ATP-dependent DNA helicase RecQ